ncbi:bifunctional riboflavin kinase/FAD synthetase [Acidiferrobacter sp.]|uniref:bifunctional riboflavin kinase/FAD synthetase n=1 Tax=Acidiferrobacter sp. TaxID=1872107 RepID=UPI00262C4C9A|nr:bifunctional riboflavin kinase/FAD synthetase [Acidiferrobacter sp.]
MECIRGLYNVRPRHRGAVITIGNFDGFHQGHRQLVGLLEARAQAHDASSLVMLFEPQPQEYFARGEPRTRLMRLSAKLAALRAAGVDYAMVLRFDERLATLPAVDFIEAVLAGALGARGLVIGDDFRFGAGRAGDFAMLKAAGARHGFFVESTGTLSETGYRVSSTRLRTALARGDMREAERLIGAPYHYGGRVVVGDARGRLLGFPTANILMPDPPPVAGVFAVTVRTEEGRVYAGIANAGRRPTVGGGRILLEVHLLDFAGDLYGQRLQVGFLERLREEQRFPSLEALTAQIERDRACARTFFVSRGMMEA